MTTRKRDPIVAVLQYFETAEPALAQQALSLVKEIVRKRQPAPRRAPAARTKKANGGDLRLDPHAVAGPD